MAVSATKTTSSLVMKVKTGMDTNGNDILASQKFSKVKVTAVDQNIFDTAAALAQLLAYELSTVTKADETVLANE